MRGFFSLPSLSSFPVDIMPGFWPRRMLRGVGGSRMISLAVRVLD